MVQSRHKAPKRPSKTKWHSGQVGELLDALPKYIEAQVKKEMLAHLKDYHNMSFGIDDIYGCCDTIRNFEKDLSLYSKSIQQTVITRHGWRKGYKYE